MESLGRELSDAGLRSLIAYSNGLQSVALEFTTYVRSAFDEGSAAADRIAAAGSAEAMIKAHSDYGRCAYEALVTQATQMTGICADTARDAMQPFEMVNRRAG